MGAGGDDRATELSLMPFDEAQRLWGRRLERLTKSVIGASMAVQRALGPGFLEAVYENALSVELGARGIFHRNQVPIPVFYRNQPVGDYVVDLVVENALIVEIKAVSNLHPRHETQLVNYLTAVRAEIGLLLNFGEDRLVFKKKFRTYRPSSDPATPSPL